MARYVTIGKYTAATVQALLKSPSDREAATRAAISAAGGTLEGWYYAPETGEVFAISTFEDETAASALLLAISATGATEPSSRATRVLTGSEFAELCRQAASTSYTAPGR
ncbi:MAG: GYD domain-containing protein [Acidimicrobiales bacterium]